MACTWFGEICSCALNNSNNKFHKTTYRPYFRALYVSVDYWTMIEAPLTDMLFLSMKRHEIRKYILNYVLGFWAKWRWRWKEDHTTFVLKNSQVTIVRGLLPNRPSSTRASASCALERAHRSERIRCRPLGGHIQSDVRIGMGGGGYSKSWLIVPWFWTTKIEPVGRLNEPLAVQFCYARGQSVSCQP